jgi:hypothetical protein
MSRLVPASTLPPHNAAAAAAAAGGDLCHMPLPAGKGAPGGMLFPSTSAALVASTSQGSLLGLRPLSPGLPTSSRQLLASASASGSLSSSWLELGSVYDSRVPSDFLLLEEEEEGLGLGGCCPSPASLLLDPFASHAGLTPLGPPTAAPAPTAGGQQDTAADGLASFLAGPASSDGAPAPDLDDLLPSEALTPGQGGTAEPSHPRRVPDLLLGSTSGAQGTPERDLVAQGSNSPGLLPSSSRPMALRGGPGGDSSSPWCLMIPSSPAPSPPGSCHTSSSPRLAFTPTSPALLKAVGGSGGAMGGPQGQAGSPGGADDSSSSTPKLYRLVRVDDVTGAPLREATADEAQELSAALAAEGTPTPTRTAPPGGKASCGSSGRKAGGSGGSSSSSSSRPERDNEWGDDLDVPCARPPRPFHHKGGGPCDHCGVMGEGQGGGVGEGGGHRKGVWVGG